MYSTYYQQSILIGLLICNFETVINSMYPCNKELRALRGYFGHPMSLKIRIVFTNFFLPTVKVKLMPDIYTWVILKIN